MEKRQQERKEENVLSGERKPQEKGRHCVHKIRHDKLIQNQLKDCEP